MDEISGILNTVKRATAFDLFLISFLALPFVFNAWLDIFTNLGFSAQWKNRSLVVLLVFYIIGIITMYAGNRAQKQRDMAKDQIIGYLQAKGFTMMSYSRVRQKINESYSDKFLEQVIDNFPKYLRRAKLAGNKSGIARLVVENTTEDEA